MPVSTPRDKIVQTRLRQLRRALRGVERGDSDAIHVARTATRRLRELVPLLGLDKARRRRLVGTLRKAGRRLGRLRTVDSQLALVDAMLRVDGLSGPLLEEVGARLREEALRGRRRLANARLTARLDAAVQTIENALLDPDVPGDVHALRMAALARVGRRTGQLRGVIGSVGALYQPEQLHRVRVTVKQLRYATEVLVESSGRASSRDLQVLKRVQDILGKQHDAQVLLELIRAAERGSGGASIAGWRECERLGAFLDGRCRRLHARFITNHAALLEACTRLRAAASRAARRQRRIG